MLSKPIAFLAKQIFSFITLQLRKIRRNSKITDAQTFTQIAVDITFSECKFSLVALGLRFPVHKISIIQNVFGS